MNILRVRPSNLSAPRPPCRASRVLLVSAVSFVALLGTTLSAIDISAEADTFVQSGSSADNSGSTVLSANGAVGSEKQILLRFRVTPAAVNSAKPTSAILKIKKNTGATAAGKVIRVHAANNNWQDTVVWTGKPNITDIGGAPLVETAGNVASQVMSFDVTDYISGPGVFTFCISTTAASDVNFKSSEAASEQPVLSVTAPTAAADFTRQVMDVLADGERYIARYKTANPGSDDDIDKVGLFDASKFPYRMSPSASAADNTMALQRAVNEARDARVALYLPPGEYRINDQIQFIQGIVPYPNDGDAPYPDEIHGERWDLNDFPCVLIGNPTADPGERSTLVLANGSPGFDGSGDPKSMLYFWSRNQKDALADPQTNRLASHFNQVLAHIDLQLGEASVSGLNGGAIGVDIGGAQGTSVHHVNVDATKGFAGFRGLPGPGGLAESITVTNGSYGLYALESDQNTIWNAALDPVVVSSSFTGQSQSAVWWEGQQGLVLVGCYISSSSGTPITVGASSGPNEPREGNITLVDCRVERSSVGPMITGTRSIYLRDVYGNNINPIATVSTSAGDSSPAIKAGASGYLHIREYWDGVKLVMNDGSAAAFVPARINGALQTPIYLSASPLSSASLIPDDLLTRHESPLPPKWNAGTVINVKDSPYSAVGNGDTNDRAAIQAAIDAAAISGQQVFLPRGEYLLDNTLELKNNVVLFGIDKSFSRLKHVAGTFDNDTSQGYVDDGYEALVHAGTGTYADKFAATMLSDLMLFMRQNEPNTYLLDWEVGRNSVVRNVNFDRRNVGSGFTMGHALVRVHDNGGGRWYNFWNDSDASQKQLQAASGNHDDTYHHITIEDTQRSAADAEPIRFYMLNAETDSNVAQVYLKNVAQVDVFQTKWEAKNREADGVTDDSPILQVVNSSDIRFFGFGGNAAMASDGDTADTAMNFTDSSRFLLAQQNFQLTKTLTHNFPWVNDDGTTTPSREQFVLYRRDDPYRTFTANSVAGEDGWMLADGTLGTGAGGPNALIVGDKDMTSGSDLQYKAMLSFDTSGLPDDAVVEKVTLRLRLGQVTNSPGTTFGNLRGDIKALFGTGNGLAPGDFNDSGFLAFDVAQPSVVNEWVEIRLTSVSQANLDSSVGKGVNGRTQIRLSFQTATGHANFTDTLGFYSADNGVVDNRPVLMIYYTLP